MDKRAYLILDMANDHLPDIAVRLMKMPGVMDVELLEGPPDIMVSIGAPDRYELAEDVNKILASFENVIEDSMVLPVESGSVKNMPTTMPLF